MVGRLRFPLAGAVRVWRRLRLFRFGVVQRISPCQWLSQIDFPCYCVTQLIASCKSSSLEQMCGVRKYTTIHLTLIWSLSGHLQIRYPERNPICILSQSVPHDNSLQPTEKWMREVTVTERLPHALFHLVKTLAK